jgi:hypothetical protein
MPEALAMSQLAIRDGSFRVTGLSTRSFRQPLAISYPSSILNDVTLGFVETGGERRRLAEVAAQADHFEARIGLHKVREQREAAIRGSVVYENDLVRLGQGLQH